MILMNNPMGRTLTEGRRSAKIIGSNIGIATDGTCEEQNVAKTSSRLGLTRILDYA